MIGVAIIGAGSWGPNLIRNFHNTETSRVLWVIDRDVSRLGQVRARFADLRVAEDADRALLDPAVDAVVIATPTSTHYPLAKAALVQRKHVFVEKPIATDSAQALELVEAAERAERVLMVGHVFVYNAGIRKVKEYLDAGTLGRLYYIAMARTNLGPIRFDVNAAWDLAAHDLSIVHYWLGAEPLAVSAVGYAWLNPGIEDAVFATVRYPNNVLVNLHVSWLNPRKARDITVVGEQRMLTFDDMNLSEPLRIYDKQVTDARSTPAYIDSFASYRSSIQEGDITIPRASLGEPLKAECEHFLDCITSGRPCLSDGRSGVAVVRALEAVQRSVQSGGHECAVTH